MAEQTDKDAQCSLFSREALQQFALKGVVLCKRNIYGYDKIDWLQVVQEKDMERLVFLAIVLICIVLVFIVARLACYPLSAMLKCIKKTPSQLSFMHRDSIAYTLIFTCFSHLIWTSYLEKVLSVPTSFVIFVYRLFCGLNVVLPAYLPAIFKNLYFLPNPGMLYKSSLLAWRALLSAVRGFNSFIVSLGAWTWLRVIVLLAELPIMGYMIWYYMWQPKPEDKARFVIQIAMFVIDFGVFGIEARNILKHMAANRKTYKKINKEQEQAEGEGDIDMLDDISSGSDDTDTGDVNVLGQDKKKGCKWCHSCHCSRCHCHCHKRQ